MSDFAPHAAVGAVTGISIAGIGAMLTNLSWETSLMCGVASFLGALSPDMDVKSHSSRICYALVLIGSIALFCTGNVLLGFLVMAYSILPQLFTHRGAGHTLIYGAITSLFLVFLLRMMLDFGSTESWAIGGSFLVGFLTHLLMDEV